MKIPTLRGTIDRRLLVNFALDPEVVAGLLPQPFRPKLVAGRSVGGICLIRLTNVRPRGLPARVGLTSENAAHRIAVVWNDGNRECEGVFIPRRDTSSALNVAVGGRLFPGIHHRASFDVHEGDGHYRIACTSEDGRERVAVSGKISDAFPARSVFPSLGAASSFFEGGSVGFSATRDPHRFDGLELRTERWHVRPLEVDDVASSFFSEPLFPPGSTTFDSALVMTDVEHEWRSLAPMCSTPSDVAA